MAKLYLFPVKRESVDLARSKSKEIVDEISRSYALCLKYLEPVTIVNISSERNGFRNIEFIPEIPSAFQVSDVGRVSEDVKDLVSVVTSCLQKRGIEYNLPFEFPF